LNPTEFELHRILSPAYGENEKVGEKEPGHDHQPPLGSQFPIHTTPDGYAAGIASDGIEVVEHDVYRYPAGAPSDAHEARHGPSVGDSSSRGGCFPCDEGDDVSI